MRSGRLGVVGATVGCVAGLFAVGTARLDTRLGAWFAGALPGVTSSVPRSRRGDVWIAQGSSGSFAFHITASCASMWPLAALLVVAAAAVALTARRIPVGATAGGLIAACVALVLGNAIRTAVVSSAVAEWGTGSLVVTHDSVGAVFGLLVFAFAVVVGIVCTRRLTGTRACA